MSRFTSGKSMNWTGLLRRTGLLITTKDSSFGAEWWHFIPRQGLWVDLSEHKPPHWFCGAPEASTLCQFLSIHSALSSVSLIGSPPISKIPQPHRNWLPLSHTANAIVQVHSVSLWMRWSLTHELWDKRPMGCFSTSFLNRNNFLPTTTMLFKRKKKSLPSSQYHNASFGKR